MQIKVTNISVGSEANKKFLKFKEFLEAFLNCVLIFFLRCFLQILITFLLTGSKCFKRNGCGFMKV